MNHYETIGFYLELVRRAQERGIRCAITSGMACVAFEVAEATKDCDLLCDPDAADRFLELLAEISAEGSSCQYRGNISPPLEARWLKGGWTSHFEWPGTEAYLDVFGIAPRARASWLEEMVPPYAHPHVVADMKRTGRDKDWPFITNLGALLIERGDDRGWLHLYDAALIRRLAAERAVPPEMLRIRPALRLAMDDPERLAEAMAVERMFWQHASNTRVKYYERYLRPYLVAVRKAEAARECKLPDQHRIRVECATAHLPLQPLGETEFAGMVAEARRLTLRLIHPSLEEWLPDMRENYRLLIPTLQ